MTSPPRLPFRAPFRTAEASGRGSGRGAGRGVGQEGGGYSGVSAVDTLHIIRGHGAGHTHHPHHPHHHQSGGDGEGKRRARAAKNGATGMGGMGESVSVEMLSGGGDAGASAASHAADDPGGATLGKGETSKGGQGESRGSGEVVQQDDGDEYKLRLGSRGRDGGMKGGLTGAKSKRSLHRYQMQLVRLQESRTRAKINQEKALASYGAHVTGASLLQVPTSWYIMFTLRSV